MTDLQTEVVARTAIFTMDRPHVHNAIGGTLLRDLLDGARRCAADPGIGAVVVAASGGAWSAGGEMDKLESLFGPGSDPNRMLHRGGLGGEKGLPSIADDAVALDRVGIGAWGAAFRAVEVPLIAAIDGAVAGGGLALALLFDIRIASTSARFLPVFAGFGLGPEMGTSWLLPRIAGASEAAYSLLANKQIGPQRAAEIGLVDERVVAPSDLRSTAIAVAEEIAGLPFDRSRALVRALRASPENDMQNQLGLEWQLHRSL